MIAPAGAELGHQPAPEDHEHPVAADQLVEIVGDDQHARTRGARLLEDPEQRLLGRDVDTLGRMRHHQHLGLRRERPAHHGLLLIATTQKHHLLGYPGSLDSQFLEVFLRRLFLIACPHDSET